MAITKEEVLKMDYAALVAAIKAPATSKEMQQLLRDRQVAVYSAQLVQAHKDSLDAREAAADATARTIPPTTEELAAEAAAVAGQPEATPVVVAPPPPVVEWADEDKAATEAGITVYRDANGKIARLVQEYQVADENGTPIGRPTHLESKSWAEHAVKQKNAHQNATQAFHRLKKQKLTFKENEAKRVLTPEEIKAAATKALEAKDAAEAENVVKDIIETNFKQQEEVLARKKAEAEGFAIGNQFLRRHLHDYLPVEANNKALGEYLRDNGMDYTLDNLEVAFLDLTSENKLVKVRQNLPTTPVAPETITPPATPEVKAVAAELPLPAADAPVVTSARTEAVSQPSVEAQAPTPAAPVNQAPPARRPGVNGSLPPGSFSAERPEVKDPVQARNQFMKQLKDMKPEVMKAKLKNDPQFVKQLESYGIRTK
jgi:hypothetical protein